MGGNRSKRVIAKKVRDANKGVSHKTPKGLMKRLEFMKNNGYHDPNGVVRDFFLPKRGREMMFSHQSATIARGGLQNPVTGIDFHPELPFLSPFKIGGPAHFRREAYCFMHYLVDAHKIAVSVNLQEFNELLIDCGRSPWYCRHWIRFWELFMSYYDWASTLEYMRNNHCKEGETFCLLLLGHDFTSDYDKDVVHVTVEWMNFSHEDPYDIIHSSEEQCMYFRSKMLAENGYNEMQHLDLITREPFDYDDYPQWYVNRLTEAKQRYENKVNPDSGSFWDGHAPDYNGLYVDPWEGYQDFGLDDD